MNSLRNRDTNCLRPRNLNVASKSYQNPATNVKKVKPVLKWRHKNNKSETPKIIINKLFNKLSDLESKTCVSQSIISNSQSSISGERNYEYLKVVSRSKAFKSDEEKAAYLLKELEHALVKVDILELEASNLRRENDTWKGKVKANSEHTNLKEEIRKLRETVAEQESQLDLFKKEIIIKYCN